MGYLSCDAESAIATCDSYNWPHLKTKPPTLREFTHDQLLTATSAFAAEAFLGKGSHGSVYKAILDDGNLVAAVKKTKLPSSAPSFHDNEIEILSRLRHPRLVNLIGFCPDTKMIVVEFMPNGSLYDLLHSREPRLPGWTRRLRFGAQVAKAVQALHHSNPPVIHRDIKSSNVLIDSRGSARLSDFGLALRGHVEDVRVKSTPPAGTLGYLDPTYLAPGDLSAKSDVFSFGVLLLELVSGRRAIDVSHSPPSILDWAAPLVRRGDYAALCDPRIPLPDKGLARGLAVLAARCARPAAEKRPDMSEVVECLNSLRKRAHVPPMWIDLRRRVRCEDVSTEPLLACHRESNSSPRAARAVNPPSPERVVIRSKSIGSSGERRPGVVAVKLPVVVRLGKSKSVGGVVFERDPHCRPRGFELTNRKLTIRLDEGEMLEKPLVSISH